MSSLVVEELVALRSTAMATGDYSKLKTRMAQLHDEGWTYTAIGAPLGYLNTRVKIMVQQAKQGAS